MKKQQVRDAISLTFVQCFKIAFTESFGFLLHLLLLFQLLLGNTDYCAKYELPKIAQFNKILTRGKHAV